MHQPALFTTLLLTYLFLGTPGTAHAQQKPVTENPIQTEVILGEAEAVKSVASDVQLWACEQAHVNYLNATLFYFGSALTAISIRYYVMENGGSESDGRKYTGGIQTPVLIGVSALVSAILGYQNAQAGRRASIVCRNKNQTDIKPIFKPRKKKT